MSCHTNYIDGTNSTGIAYLIVMTTVKTDIDEALRSLHSSLATMDLVDNRTNTVITHRNGLVTRHYV